MAVAEPAVAIVEAPFDRLSGAVGAGVSGGWADTLAAGSTAGAEMAAGVPTTASAAGIGMITLIVAVAVPVASGPAEADYHCRSV